MDELIEKLADYLMSLPEDTEDIPFKSIEEAIGLPLPVEAESDEWWNRFMLLSNADIDFEWITLTSDNPNYVRVYKSSMPSSYKRLARSKELFLERWELPNQADEFSVVLNRVLNECSEFFSTISSSPTHVNLLFSLLGLSSQFHGRDRSKIIYNMIAETKNVVQLTFLLQMLFNVLRHFTEYDAMKDLKRHLSKVLVITSNPPFFLDTDIVNGEINIYKGGAELLDSRVVNDSLHWLTKYPEVRKLFANALKNYSEYNQTDENARSIYDDLRASLEKLVKQILGNSKTLENNKKGIEEWLKGKGTHSQVVKIFSNILNSYIVFMNDVKHVSNYSSNDLEFMVYQTAIMMRMLLEKEHVK
jgi:hypothetical protein